MPQPLNPSILNILKGLQRGAQNFDTGTFPTAPTNQYGHNMFSAANMIREGENVLPEVLNFPSQAVQGAHNFVQDLPQNIGGLIQGIGRRQFVPEDSPLNPNSLSAANIGRGFRDTLFDPSYTGEFVNPAEAGHENRLGEQQIESATRGLVPLGSNVATAERAAFKGGHPLSAFIKDYGRSMYENPVSQLAQTAAILSPLKFGVANAAGLAERTIGSIGNRLSSGTEAPVQGTLGRMLPNFNTGPDVPKPFTHGQDFSQHMALNSQHIGYDINDEPVSLPNAVRTAPIGNSLAKGYGHIGEMKELSNTAREVGFDKEAEEIANAANSADAYLRKVKYHSDIVYEAQKRGHVNGVLRGLKGLYSDLLENNKDRNNPYTAAPREEHAADEERVLTNRISRIDRALNIDSLRARRREADLAYEAFLHGRMADWDFDFTRAGETVEGSGAPGSEAVPEERVENPLLARIRYNNQGIKTRRPPHIEPPIE